MSIYATAGEFLGREYRGSHLYPSRDDPPAEIGLAHIPAHCVPGHTDDEGTADWPANGEWLRVDIAVYATATDPSAIVIDRTTARDLAHALLEWAATPQVAPGEAA